MFRELNCPEGRIVCGIGVFDGVHLGHRQLLDQVLAMAARHRALPMAVTFAPHPRQVLAPEHPPRLLIPLAVRLKLLRESGMRHVAVVPFTRELAATPPMDFLSLLADFPGELCGICVGANWHFGAHAAGGAAELTAFAAERKLEFRPVPELAMDGRTVSSTEIRRAVAAGRLADAERMLGRPYSLTGTVVHGFHDATEKLDCPTANLVPEEGILPPDGVYAAYAVTAEGRRFPAAVNIGFSPTFRRPEGERRVELHLLDYNGDLYGQELGLIPVRCLRPERVFPDPAALKRQILQDIAEIRKWTQTEGK